MLHGEAVAGEGVGGVELEDFVEGCDLAHMFMVRGCGRDCKFGPNRELLEGVEMGGSGGASHDAHLSDDGTVAKMGHPDIWR